MNETLVPLVKYVPPERVDILETERIAFTPPLRFNDPFDFHPAVAPMLNRAHLRRFVSNSEAERQISKSESLTRKAKRRHRLELRRDLVNYMRQEAEPIAGKIQSRMFQQMNQRGGVLCLTTVLDSLLMWAHYAASHRGFLLEFDSQSSVFRQLGKPMKVHYSSKRPLCDATKTVDLSWFLTKSIEWSYEMEYRIVREFKHCQSVQKNGNTIHVCPLPKQAIKAIYLGVNMEKATRERAAIAVRGTHIQLFQAQLPRKTFGLEFQSLH